ncbi:uncharacterized protein MONOS_13488 [Monocercomonoides exilis]|uniref:uncharacterized protein n=1 Tax=Monocercomonoides exilis TaxID=2049356 RepID=UPI00355A2A61|nr:hypothetical protein MONOS_13488 [Monocercomonoides exilis]|eukprot:MONOS_13488.1-p1 / transcript=MONOS_13488.1 / gene=MONOS_13488 / organism=Monocercomonoides_exilis_PA203 / gene_product=unspecified product / transcript_product=unspecified product / location=Mono_scaffold00836:2436-2858(+) / protein_length=140 / sequence_SO=supercontig / SO=protein_coding / is_pseudo=false
MSQIYEKEKHTIEELDQRLQKSALHYTTDKINSKLKRSSQELEEVIEEKTRQIPLAIEPEPINIPDDCLQLVECEVTKTKRKRGRPKKAVVPKINAKEKKKYNMLLYNMRNLLKADKQEGKTLAELSEKYNVSISTVSKI